jgi:hypothetical protein
MVNWAGVVAAVNVLRGHRIDRWEPVRSPRPLDVDAVAQRDAPRDGLDR